MRVYSPVGSTLVRTGLPLLWVLHPRQGVVRDIPLLTRAPDPRRPPDVRVHAGEGGGGPGRRPGPVALQRGGLRREAAPGPARTPCPGRSTPPARRRVGRVDGT